jgi:hypothetical protein
MANEYGYEERLWDAAKVEMREALAERARIGKTISYSELVETLTAIDFEPNSRALAAMLCEVSEAENARGRGMLSAIVVNLVATLLREKIDIRRGGIIGSFGVRRGNSGFGIVLWVRASELAAWSGWVDFVWRRITAKCRVCEHSQACRQDTTPSGALPRL